MTKTLFQIQTAQEVFYQDLHNWWVDPMVRGNLVLFPNSPVSIHRIHLRLIGRVFIKQAYQRFEKVLVEKCLNFIPEKGGSCTFGPYVHSFGFQFELPGELPESLQATNCKVEYILHAIAKTSLFRSNLRTKKTILVRKILGPILGTDYSTHCQGIHKDLIEYNVDLPTLEFSRGDRFQVNFRCRLLQEKIKPKFVACGLREQVVYRIPMDECYTHKVFEESWITAVVESYQTNETVTSLSMRVPKSAREIQHSYQSEYIEISHYLYAQIQFPGVNVQVSFPVLITRKEAITPALPPAYEVSCTLPPPYQLTSAQNVVSKIVPLSISQTPIATAISLTVKHARGLSIPNPIAILTH